MKQIDIDGKFHKYFGDKTITLLSTALISRNSITFRAKWCDCVTPNSKVSTKSGGPLQTLLNGFTRSAL